MNLSELWNRELSENEAKNARLLFLFVAISIVFGFNIYVEVMSRTVGSNTLQNEVKSLTEKDNTDLEKLHSCADWLNSARAQLD